MKRRLTPFYIFKGGMLLKGLAKLIKSVDPVTLTMTAFFFGTWWTLSRIEGKINQIQHCLEMKTGYHF